jgi:hypothetical protein
MAHREAGGLLMRSNEIDACIAIFRDGIEKTQLPLDEVPELIDSLERNEDFISDELGFEFVAGRLRVSLHDRDAWCDPKEFLTALQKMYAHRESM